MRSLHFYIVLSLLGLLSVQLHAQVNDSRKYSLADTIQHYLPSDTLGQSVGVLQDSLSQKLENTQREITSPFDSARNELAALKQTLLRQLDSLEREGKAVDSLHKQLNKLEELARMPQEQFEKLLLVQQDLKTALDQKIPEMDTLRRIGETLNEKISEIDDVSTKLGIGPLGKDLRPELDPSLTSISLPETPGIEFRIDNAVDLPTQNIIPDPGVEFPDPDPITEFTGRIGSVDDKIADVSDGLNQAGEIARQADEYATVIKTIQEEGLGESETISDLAEQKVLSIDEVQALQQQGLSPAEIKKYEKMIELYKEEKRLLAEMKEKSRELANDVIMRNQEKVDGAMQKVAKFKRKYPDLPDMSNLPKRAANPVKKLPRRERVIPGLTFQTLKGDELWLQIDPHLQYRLNRRWHVGVGGVYRFSMNPDKLTFDGFNSMHGAKSFVQYHGFKSFFLRAETQYISWKPWRFAVTDPDYNERSCVGVVGIGKAYSIAKRIKGNAQTLYHWTWDGADPYKQKIMIRFGFDFSLRKEEEKPWQKKWKAFKKSK